MSELSFQAKIKHLDAEINIFLIKKAWESKIESIKRTWFLRDFPEPNQEVYLSIIIWESN